MGGVGNRALAGLGTSVSVRSFFVRARRGAVGRSGDRAAVPLGENSCADASSGTHMTGVMHALPSAIGIMPEMSGLMSNSGARSAGAVSNALGSASRWVGAYL